MQVNIALAYEHPQAISELFSEYTDMLIENEPPIADYLALQAYDEELEDLTVKYGLPEGRLYLAKINNQVAGCIGLKKIDDKNCEMKRLYVRPAFRGHHIATKLVEKIIYEAKQIGYHYMFLDTLPFLTSAIQIYKGFGFYEIDAYNNSPLTTSIYMKLHLQSS